MLSFRHTLLLLLYIVPFVFITLNQSTSATEPIQFVYYFMSNRQSNGNQNRRRSQSTDSNESGDASDQSNQERDQQEVGVEGIGWSSVTSCFYGSVKRNFSIYQFYVGGVETMRLSPDHKVAKAYFAMNKKFILRGDGGGDNGAEEQKDEE